MIRRPPRSTRTDTLFPSTTLFRALSLGWNLPAASRRRCRVFHSARALRNPAPRDPVGEFGGREAHDAGPDDDDLHRLQTRSKTIWAAARSSMRSEEHTSELQSLMRISYAVFCLKKKKIKNSYKTMKTHT